MCFATRTEPALFLLNPRPYPPLQYLGLDFAVVVEECDASIIRPNPPSANPETPSLTTNVTETVTRDP